MKILMYFLRFLKFIFLTILCIILWLLFSFEFNHFAIIAGVIISILISIFTYNYFYHKDMIRKLNFIYRIDLLALLFLILLIEIYISSIVFIYMMFKGGYNPGIIRIKTNIRSKVGRVILAYAISLTPGTLSLWMEDNKIYIHWFNIKTTHSLIAGDMIKKRVENIIIRLFG